MVALGAEVDRIEPGAAAMVAQHLLGSAMEVRRGRCPAIEGQVVLENPYLRMTRDAFVFTTTGGARIHYRRGGHVTLDCPDPALEGECRLYLWGTVFGAVAWINGMMPLHCSAVARGGRAVAFTAASGGGKSTLAAALGQRGFSHVCDDTLVVSELAGEPWAIPDGKPAKLWADALQLLGRDAGEPVATLAGKFYSEVPGVPPIPCQLLDLVFVADGPEVTIEPITGSAKLERLGEAIYRGFIHTALGDRAFHARMMLLLARQVSFWQLQRPRDPARFAETGDAIAKLLADIVRPV